MSDAQQQPPRGPAPVLGASQGGLYNFQPSVQPCSVQLRVAGAAEVPVISGCDAGSAGSEVYDQKQSSVMASEGASASFAFSSEHAERPPVSPGSCGARADGWPSEVSKSYQGSASVKSYYQARRSLALHSKSHSSVNVSRAVSEPSSEFTCEPSLTPADERCELAKCTMAVLVVLTMVVGGSTYLVLAGARDEEPTCSEAEREEARSCEPCGGRRTLWLPFGGAMELGWPQPLRAVLYFLGLLWCFLGVGLVCDEFMSAIEKITSAKRSVWMTVGDSRQKFHVSIWNATIANLTLMALGSSAPEILLSVVELYTNGLFAGELGPSTVVGSAAFNLFIITAVCISAIPAPEVRKIELIQVFGVTALVSILAYFWLWVILQAVSPNKVDIWEAVVTLMMCPALVLLAFAADKGWLLHPIHALGNFERRTAEEEDSRIRREQAKIKSLYGKQMTVQNVKRLITIDGHCEDDKQRKSRAQIRKDMMKGLFGGKKDQQRQQETTFGFAEQNYAVLECAGTAEVRVVASQRPEVPVELTYRTIDGDAKADVRYRHTEGVVSFGPFDLSRTIEIPVIDNDQWDRSEEFYVELTSLQAGAASGMVKTPSYGRSKSMPSFRIELARTAVWVINDDEPGTLDFQAHEVMACEGMKTVSVQVVRKNGTCGRISVHYETADDTAEQGRDYVATEGELHFDEGEAEKTLKIKVLGKGRRGKRRFRVLLNNPSEGVAFDELADGDGDGAMCEVILPGNTAQVMHGLSRALNWARFSHALSQWREKVPEALYCGGSAREQSEASALDWASHVVALFWKVLFLLVPPPALCGGWATFVCALSMIGFVTALINDLASLLGCTVGMPDDITALTLVALGTSLPDTFASRTAAVQDDCADNSIGNVTGSNSVNVFLGLGLPWTFGAIYWHIQGRSPKWRSHRHGGQTFEALFGAAHPEGGFFVPAESFPFSVAVFSACAVVCIVVLMYRRYAYGGELGGPKLAQRRDSAILVTLWLVYIVASIVRSTTKGG